MAGDLSRDWERFVTTFEPKAFSARLNASTERALGRVGFTAVREARRLIKARSYEKNADATKRRKGSTVPLVDKGDLFGSVGTGIREVSGEAPEAILGANKRTPGGVNLAAVLHEGVKNKSGQGWRIPPREFLVRPAESSAVARSMDIEAARAIHEAVTGRGQ